MAVYLYGIMPPEGRFGYLYLLTHFVTLLFTVLRP